jgi:anti-anti-sigma factor
MADESADGTGVGDGPGVGAGGARGDDGGRSDDGGVASTIGAVDVVTTEHGFDVRLSGELDQLTTQVLRSLARQVARRTGSVEVRIDGSEVTFASSALLGGLVGVHRAVVSAGGRAVLTAASPVLSRILELSSMTSMFAMPDGAGGASGAGPA